MDLTLQEMAVKLREYPSYRIYFHKSPDGDAIMSAYALALALQAIGISCEPVCCDPIPDVYHDIIAEMSFDSLDSFTNIAVDSADAKRLGKYKDEKITLCIDHHENKMEADYRYVVPEASSCCELIYQLIREMNVPVTKHLANLLYTGLITDTMCFRTHSTTPASLKTAASLAQDGADIVRIARRFSLEKTQERIAIEQVLLDSFHYTCSHQILGCMFTYDDLCRIGADDSQLEGLNLVVDQVQGLAIGIVVRETRPSHCRVSVRTYTGLNAVKICEKFNGGGHADRAGCELETNPAEALRMVEEAAEAYLSEN